MAVIPTHSQAGCPTPSKGGTTPGAPGTAPTLVEVCGELQRLFATDPAEDELLDRLARVLAHHGHADVVAHYRAGRHADEPPRLQLLASSVEQVAESIQTWCMSFASHAVAEGALSASMTRCGQPFSSSPPRWRPAHRKRRLPSWPFSPHQPTPPICDP